MSEYIHLDEHVGRVLVPNLPTNDDAFLVCLTSQEVHIIRAFVFPYASWRTRFVRWVQDNLFQTATPEELSTYQEMVEELDDTLGGALMPCSDIKEGLEAIAAALSGLGGGVTNVSCGGGACGAIGGAMADMPNDDILPPDPVTEPDPGGDPPEGFDTWEAYYTHKCKAAEFLWLGIRNLIQTIGGLSGAVAVMSTTAPAVVAWVATTGVVFPPAAFALLATYILAFMVLAIGAFYSMQEALEYWDDNHVPIVCAMYQSGSAADAITVLADFYEDAIESVTWVGVLAPLGSVLAAALSQVGATAINTSMVNVLFTLAQDVVVPDATCDCSDVSEWHFDAGVEGWVFVGDPPSPVTETHGWTDAESGKDPSDQSPGRLYVNVDMVAYNPPTYYPVWQRSLPPGLVVATGDTLQARVFAGPDNSFIIIGIEYTDDTNDNSGWTAWVNWGSATATVTAPNNGKTIKRLWAAWERRATGTGAFALDNVVLNLA
jgi:hypothetical protein